jgi:winged helix-turn-helix protein
VARWIERRTGRRGVRAQRGWEYLRKLGNTPQVPRPSNAEAGKEEQEAFKKATRAAEGALIAVCDDIDLYKHGAERLHGCYA